jgi:hypothetical protein
LTNIRRLPPMVARVSPSTAGVNLHITRQPVIRRRAFEGGIENFTGSLASLMRRAAFLGVADRASSRSGSPLKNEQGVLNQLRDWNASGGSGPRPGAPAPE